MPIAQRWLLLSLIALTSCRPHDPGKLEPNARITIAFPDLPQTFFAQQTGKKQPAMLSAQLPENYSLKGLFPLFVYLGGDNGGPGDAAAFVRGIVGPRDFIAVNLPLFKDASAKNHPTPKGFPINVDGLINGNDTALASRCYRVMLQKLFETVPNITAERSAFGGFSNGAHATSFLIAEKDEFILEHFTSFCFLEGGLGLVLKPTALADPTMKSHRFLMLFGDHDDDPKLQALRKIYMPMVDEIEQQSRASQLDFTRITMRGYGHAQPSEYLERVGRWVRREKLAGAPSPAPGTSIPQNRN